MFAIVEAGPLPGELTDELDTVGAYDFDGTLAWLHGAPVKPTDGY
jgi:hypothetical protein